MLHLTRPSLFPNPSPPQLSMHTSVGEAKYTQHEAYRLRRLQVHVSAHSAYSHCCADITTVHLVNRKLCACPTPPPWPPETTILLSVCMILSTPSASRKCNQTILAFLGTCLLPRTEGPLASFLLEQGSEVPFLRLNDTPWLPMDAWVIPLFGYCE